MFWVVTLCSVAVGYNISEDLAAPIFTLHTVLQPRTCFESSPPWKPHVSQCIMGFHKRKCVL